MLNKIASGCLINNHYRYDKGLLYAELRTYADSMGGLYAKEEEKAASSGD